MSDSKKQIVPDNAIGCSAAVGPQIPGDESGRSAADILYFVVLPYDHEELARDHAYELEQDDWEAWVIKASKAQIAKLKLPEVVDDH